MSDVRQSGEAPTGCPTAAETQGKGPASGISSAEHLACALHEVSNALTVVLGWLDVAENADAPEARRAIAVAKEHARRGQVMARRSIGADVDSVVQEQNAAEIAQVAATSIEPHAAAKGVSVRCRCGPGTDVQLPSPEKVLQILTNLLMNGLSFSPSAGELSIAVERQDRLIRFEVRDEGPGVEPERRGTLFTAPTSTRSGGVGLGLPHSRHLARESGGELTIGDSEKGALFELLWPLAPAIPGRPRLKSQSSSSLDGARILVVEDDVAISALIDLGFSARGAEVIIVADAEEFVSVLRARPVLDLVLLDLSPVDDALSEALDSLEQIAPDAPVILMSGQPGGVPPEAEGRFATWVRKPFDMEELIAAASGLLARPVLSLERIS